MALHRGPTPARSVPTSAPARRRVAELLVAVSCGCALFAAPCRAQSGAADAVSKVPAPSPAGLDDAGLQAARQAATTAPAVVGAVTVEALSGRRERIAERYESWLSTREPAATLRELPEVPAAAGFPPLPDAPDGEISHELDEVAP